MRKHLLLFIFFSGIIYNSKAQVYDTLSIGSVKLDLFNFVDNFPSLMISYEHKAFSEFYLNHEAGLIIPGENHMGNISGFKLREEIRTYFSTGYKTDLYLALDVRYTQERISDNILLGYMCNSEAWWNECQFYKNFDGAFKKDLFAVGFRAGFRHSFSSLFIEYDLGYSYGKDFVSIQNVDIPPDYSLINNNPFNLFFTDWKTLITARGKIGLYLYKKPRQK